MAHVVEGFEFAGFEDDLEVGFAARGLHFTDLIGDLFVTPREERAAVDDHVDCVGPVAHGLLHVLKADRERVLPAGKPVATEATCTPLPASSFVAILTRDGYTHTAAQLGSSG